MTPVYELRNPRLRTTHQPMSAGRTARAEICPSCADKVRMRAIEPEGRVEPVEFDERVRAGRLTEIPDVSVQRVVDARLCNGPKRGRNRRGMSGVNARLN